MSRYYSGPVSDHFDGTRFFGPRPFHGKGMGQMLKWQFVGRTREMAGADREHRLSQTAGAGVGQGDSSDDDRARDRVDPDSGDEYPH